MSASESYPQVITTPLQEYVHSDRDSRIALVGMMHIGQPYYYDIVHDVVTDREDDGAVIHYELVSKSTAEELRAVDPSTKTKITQLGYIMDSVYGWLGGLEAIKLVKQLDALEYADSWENHDASELSIVGRMNGLTLRRHNAFVKLINIMVDGQNPDQREKFLVSLVKKMAEKDIDSGIGSPIVKFILGSTDKALLDYRNDVALKAIDDQLAVDPESDFALIWGAAHLPGLGQGLRRRGYSQVDEQRLPAINCEDLLDASR